MGLTSCGFLSSGCLSNSGCLGLSGLNLTDCDTETGEGGGSLVGCGGLIGSQVGGGGGSLSLSIAISSASLFLEQPLIPCSFLTLFRHCAPYRFFVFCAETVCSRQMTLSDF